MAVRERVSFQRDDGKQIEIDVVAESSDGRAVLVEVKKRQAKTGLKAVEDFAKKAAIYGQQHVDKTMLLAILSLGGFTEEARQFCAGHGIGPAERIKYSFIEAA